jgi:signal transduction histidine kinase
VFETTLDLDDRLDEAELTDSQRIALIRVVQSALANVARHSGAATAAIEIRVAPEGLRATVSDDGCGFDVDDALRAAADRGCVGLGGMRERVRLLGGEFAVASARGEGTAIRIVLPRFAGGTTRT